MDRTTVEKIATLFYVVGAVAPPAYEDDSDEWNKATQTMIQRLVDICMGFPEISTPST